MTSKSKKVSLFDDNITPKSLQFLDENFLEESQSEVEETEDPSNKTLGEIDEPINSKSLPYLDETDLIEDEEIGKETEEKSEEAQEENKEVHEQGSEGDLESEDTASFSPLFDALVEKGALYDITEEDELEDSLEGFVAKINKDKEKFFNEKLSTLSEKTRKMIEFELKGGNYEEVLQDTFDFKALEDAIKTATEKDFDLDKVVDEEDQKNILIDYYAGLGEDIEELDIEAQLEELKSSNTLAKELTRAARFLGKEQEKELKLKEQEYAQRLEIEKEKRALDAAKKEEAFKNRVLGINSLKGLEISKDDAQKLYEYMTVRDKSGKTQAEKNHKDEDYIFLEYIKMKNLDLSKIERKAQTKATKEIKNVLKRIEKPSLNAVKEEKAPSIPKIPDIFSRKHKYES